MTTERPDGGGFEATQPFTNEEIGQEPATSDTAAAEPGPSTVIVTSSEAGRRGGVRWGIALGAVAVSVGVLAAAAFLLTSQAPASRLVGWAPADAALYAEARLDLPGDQRAQLGTFLSHFPGFSDQAILDQKIDETLDRIVSEATGGKHDFSSEIKPWFDGQIAIAARAAAPAGRSEQGSGLVMVAVKDTSAARTWFEALAAESPMTLVTETYGGTDLLVAPDASGAAAFLDGVMLMGDPDSVKAAIDGAGKGELGKAPDFVAARAAFTGDQLAFAYIDVDAALAMAAAGPPDVNGAVQAGEALRGVIPAWTAMSVRTDGDGLIGEAVWPHVEGSGIATTNRASRLAERVPSSTVVLTDARDLGSVVTAMLEQIRSDPASAQGLAELEQAAALLGGLDSLVGWIGDTGVAVTRDGTKVDGGLVIVPADAAAADRLATTLSGFLNLFGADSGLQVRTEEHAGTEITIVDLGDAQDLLGGAAPGLDGLSVFGGAPSGPVELAWAINDQVVVIALGPAFVRSILDVDSGSSLADNARYRAALDLVGKDNAGSTFIDLNALREIGEGFMAAAGGSAIADYDRDVKPYLEPFDIWIQANTVGEDLDRAIMRIAVE